MVKTVLHVKDDIEKEIPLNKKIAVLVSGGWDSAVPVSYTHLRAHETREDRGLRGGG